MYKEHLYNDITEEYLKRYCGIKESKKRLQKLNEYYKNYHLFFCRLVFINWKLGNVMNNYGDNKAEVFYKVNNAKEMEENSKEKGLKLNDGADNEENNSSVNGNSSSNSSSNNNKTIFDKNTRLIIDKLANIYQKNENNNINTSNNKCTVTMMLDSSRLNTNALYSKRSKNNSFLNLINGIVTQTQRKAEEEGIDRNIPNYNNNNKHTVIVKDNNNNNKYLSNGIHTHIPQHKIKKLLHEQLPMHINQSSH